MNRKRRTQLRKPQNRNSQPSNKNMTVFYYPSSKQLSNGEISKLKPKLFIKIFNKNEIDEKTHIYGSGGAIHTSQIFNKIDKKGEDGKPYTYLRLKSDFEEVKLTNWYSDQISTEIMKLSSKKKKLLNKSLRKMTKELFSFLSKKHKPEVFKGILSRFEVDGRCLLNCLEGKFEKVLQKLTDYLDMWYVIFDKHNPYLQSREASYNIFMKFRLGITQLGKGFFHSTFKGKSQKGVPSRPDGIRIAYNIKEMSDYTKITHVYQRWNKTPNHAHFIKNGIGKGEVSKIGTVSFNFTRIQRYLTLSILSYFSKVYYQQVRLLTNGQVVYRTQLPWVAWEMYNHKVILESKVGSDERTFLLMLVSFAYALWTLKSIPFMVTDLLYDLNIKWNINPTKAWPYLTDILQISIVQSDVHRMYYSRMSVGNFSLLRFNTTSDIERKLARETLIAKECQSYNYTISCPFKWRNVSHLKKGTRFGDSLEILRGITSDKFVKSFTNDNYGFGLSQACKIGREIAFPNNLQKLKTRVNNPKGKADIDSVLRMIASWNPGEKMELVSIISRQIENSDKEVIKKINSYDNVVFSSSDDSDDEDNASSSLEMGDIDKIVSAPVKKFAKWVEKESKDHDLHDIEQALKIEKLQNGVKPKPMIPLPIIPKEKELKTNKSNGNNTNTKVIWSDVNDSDEEKE